MSRATRGRLLRPVLVEIAQLDTLATAQDQPDDNAAGGVSSGYHANFREPRLLPSTTPAQTGSPRGESARKETILRCLAQWEVENFDFQQQWASGNSPGHRTGLVFHYRDLEKRDLLDEDGNAKIHVNDRLSGIFHAKSGDLIQEIRNPPGLYITQLEPGSMGLRGAKRNVLFATLEDREQSVRRA